MSKSFEEVFKTALRKLSITSEIYQSKALKSVISVVNVEKVDPIKFEAWFNNWVKAIDFSKITAVGRYFVQTFKTQFTLGAFTLEESSASPSPGTLTPQTVEEFEASWEAWKETLRDLQEDFYEEEYPSRGVLSRDKNTNEVRAVSDGIGGLIYIDGTVSGKYSRLEELPPEEQEQLILQVKNLHGSLLGLENVIRRMKEHAEACNY